MPRPRVLSDVSCAQCATLFRPRNATSKFCTPACRHKFLSAPPKTCPQCSTVFRPRNPMQKHCSHACSSAAAKADRNTKCQQCGTMFERPHGKARAYCSRTCSMVARNAGKVADYTPLDRKTNHKGGRWINAMGYVALKVDGHSKLEHRLVVEQTLNRPLESFERVHHKNGHRKDNRPENLELWLTTAKSKKDPAGQRMEDLMNEFLTQPEIADRALIEAAFRRIFKL